MKYLSDILIAALISVGLWVQGVKVIGEGICAGKPSKRD